MKNINFLKNLIILFSIVLITPFFGCGNVGKVEKATEVDNPKNITEQDSKKRNDWEKHKLVCEVKKISEFSVNSTNNSKVTFRSETIYNRNGYIVEEKRNDGEFIYKTIYSYNEMGVLETRKNIKDDNSEFFVDKLKYDKSGILIEFSTYIDGDFISTTFIKNDENGLPIEEKTVSNDIVKKWTNKYDQSKNKIESSLYFDDELEIKSTFFYNDKGLFVKADRIDSDGNKFTNEYKYEYDQKGNWIKRITIEEGVNGAILERTIEYY